MSIGIIPEDKAVVGCTLEDGYLVDGYDGSYFELGSYSGHIGSYDRFTNGDTITVIVDLGSSSSNSPANTATIAFKKNGTSMGSPGIIPHQGYCFAFWAEYRNSAVTLVG